MDRLCKRCYVAPMRGSEIFDGVFTRICHVKHGYEDRERHILREFSQRGVPANFFLDWDVPDISPELLRSFSEGLTAPDVSLALKHLGIWKEFLDSGMPYCLVFEDDVFLAANFVPKLTQCLDEFSDPSRRAVVYLGNAGNYYIPLLRLRRGRHLYPARHGRCTDSYLITRSTAEARCDWFSRNKQTVRIDHQIDLMDGQLGVEVLWFERPIVEQGTHTGVFATSMPTKKARPGWQKRVLWHWKKSTRRLLGHMR